MPMHPVLASLRHHKLTTMLLVLQVALTCAIVCNVVFLVVNRIEQIDLSSGVDEANLALILSEGIDKGENVQARHDADLAMLRSIPGVTAAVAVDTLPLGSDESSSGTCASLKAWDLAIKADSIDVSDCFQPAFLGGTQGEIQTLGLHLIAGRDFRGDEYVVGDKVSAAILTTALARKFFPAGDALGQIIYTGERKPIRVVGIVDTLLRPRLRTSDVNQFSMLFPMKPNDNDVTYVLRSAPEDRERVLQAANAALMKIDPNRIIPASRMQTFSDMRRAYFQRDVTMVSLLVASCLGLLFVTALGISGLANFWVQQRRKQIGVRRAIGATRGDILRYFQTENFLIVTGGILLGIVLAVLLNLLLMKQYELPRLPTYYLGIGALALWVLGQLAVLGPALRAAAVPPVVATRSV